MIKIIPAIDIIEGKCVRLTQGDYAQKKIYNENPLEVAKEFEASGIKYLHLVDLDGAKSNGIVNWKVLNEISTKTNLKIDFGGGIKSDKDLEIAFENGATQLNIGSTAVKDKNLFLNWLQKYGSDKIILSADVKNEEIAVNGWQENSGINIFSFINDYLANGINHVVCTDVSKDGTLQGTSVVLYQRIMEQFPDIKLVASGGISVIEDIEELLHMPIYGVIIGKAIYENRIQLKDLKKFL
ncbi:MAG: 1-(5-phosphoribosyl)-5-[(5-phosphoribosylamino)methylideneamino]imidazole-4-carboxamide isomerase [Bacteroidales bacterium]|nr:1-(5-phosphoribosyl)-5-[(5-phosphoribosylamino)methylideneamino]imidazole-4-carboxamide isomerase [Bacteroidales bacterium]